jgi:hypothetical protein
MCAACQVLECCTPSIWRRSSAGVTLPCEVPKPESSVKMQLSLGGILSCRGIQHFHLDTRRPMSQILIAKIHSLPKDGLVD